MTLLYPPAVWRPVPSHGGPLTSHHGLVEHITTDPDTASPYGYFSDPAHQASSHLWIAGDGHVEQFIDLELASWAQAGGNYGWISVEVGGLTGSAKTPAQVEALARLWAWMHSTLGTPLQLTDDPAGYGLGWHGMGGSAWGGHTACPGTARLAQRPQVLGRALALTSASHSTTPTPSSEDDDMPLTAADYDNVIRPGLMRDVQALIRDGLRSEGVSGAVAAVGPAQTSATETAALEQKVDALSAKHDALSAKLDQLLAKLPQ